MLLLLIGSVVHPILQYHPTERLIGIRLSIGIQKREGREVSKIFRDVEETKTYRTYFDNGRFLYNFPRFFPETFLLQENPNALFVSNLTF